MRRRRARYERVAALLSSRGDGELAAWVDAAPVAGVGVGGATAVLDVDAVPVFVKRIALTDRERARPGSTANLFGLPMICQYGIGSPGLNAWRELAANRIVTDAVLSGETESFPLLYHWRVLPGRPRVPDDHVDLDTAVAALGGAPAVRARLDALRTASSSLVLFSEYVPYDLRDLLRREPESRVGMVEEQLMHHVTVLGARRILHMDAHFDNMRGDGERILLTDFGLATSPRFALSDVERDFVRRNRSHDADYAAMRLVNWVVTAVCGVATPTGGAPVARNAYVRRCAAGHIPDEVSPVVADILTRYAPAAARMNSFYWELFAARDARGAGSRAPDEPDGGPT
ncbi:protein kinase family protein [Saccharomonospora halophila]|uniref:hypothetical protein n=1 Tax=Saccharomonospora halophila TaxID=129922 RepID=UPI00048E2B82|nr:hypothetical protein [Saccharomonospora halophila]